MPRSPNKADTPKSTEKKPPEFPKLNAEHIIFLRKRQPEYLAVREQIKSVSVGQRKVKNTKGQQQQWVVDNVLPAFMKEFHDANKYSAQSVKEKLCRWFVNNANSKGKAEAKPSKDITSSKRPRAHSAHQLFGKKNEEMIRKAMAAKRAGEPVDPKENLPLYRQTRTELFEELSPEEREQYKKRAAETKTASLAGPPLSHIYENQGTLVSRISEALLPLCGKGWEQVGDVVFFVLAAHRNVNDTLKISRVTISTSSTDGLDFTKDYPGDWNTEWLKPFKKWANSAVPRTQENLSPKKSTGNNDNQPVTLREDGYPMISTIDFHDLSPKSAVTLLETYIKAAWESSWSSKVPPTGIPWEELRDAIKRKDLLVNAQALKQFKSLDPKHMGPSELYDVLHFITEEQTDEYSLFEFNLKAFSTGNTPKRPRPRKPSSRRVIAPSDDSDDDEITEVIDPHHSHSASSQSSGDSRSSSESSSPQGDTPSTPDNNGMAVPGLLPYKTVETALLEVASPSKAQKTNSSPSKSNHSEHTTPAPPSLSKAQKTNTVTPAPSPSKAQKANTVTTAPSPSKAQKTNTVTPAPSPSKAQKANTVTTAPSPSKAQKTNTSHLYKSVPCIVPRLYPEVPHACPPGPCLARVQARIHAWGLSEGAGGGTRLWDGNSAKQCTVAAPNPLLAVRGSGEGRSSSHTVQNGPRDTP